ncbi:hypothetical protein [Treponema endosymbiont of Eucomonympha sp.]|uniref:hypothetical protein n=1 Tax=Treponema endosymbiont of Eucomonympha sp. TaxID=1580831 RepID=UPI001396B7F2|nr:hypothetical protein [Treponema endosymbiont of Eucomonympha sp.]
MRNFLRRATLCPDGAGHGQGKSGELAPNAEFFERTRTFPVRGMPNAPRQAGRATEVSLEATEG